MRKVGGLADCDPNDPRVKELIDFALIEIQKSINSPQELKLSRILRAQKQVVSGTMLHLTLEVITATNAEGQSTDNESSELTEVKQSFSLKIWDQPWLKHREVRDLKCESS